MDRHTYNLFRFAPSELSHSAFWAWVLQSASAAGDPRLEVPRRVAAALLATLGIPRLPSAIRVETEHALPGHRGRADIWAKLENGDEIIIEKKVSATPDREQLERYRGHRSEDGARVHLALLTTAFDEDVRAGISDQAEWTVLRIDDLLRLARAGGGSHPLVDDYVSWLDARHQEREDWAHDAVQGSPEEMEEALWTREGQWYLMRYLTNDLPESGGDHRREQYRGTNVGGSPWTQFRFFNGGRGSDVLFFRIDFASDGPYFSLRQYQHAVSPSWDCKRERLRHLRQWWVDAWTEHGGGLQPKTRRARGRVGKKESEVGWFDLRETSPQELRRVLPAVHGTFLARVRSEYGPQAS